MKLNKEIIKMKKLSYGVVNEVEVEVDDKLYKEVFQNDDNVLEEVKFVVGLKNVKKVEFKYNEQDIYDYIVLVDGKEVEFDY